MTDLQLWLLVATSLAICIAAHWPISFVVDACWLKLGWNRHATDGFRRSTWLVALVGVIERVLFVLALYIGQPEFIGLWLTLKIASQWTQWGQDSVVLGPTAKVPGRAVFQVFLVGNAFSMLFSFAAFKSFQWLQAGQPTRAITALLILTLGTLATGAIVRVWRVT